MRCTVHTRGKHGRESCTGLSCCPVVPPLVVQVSTIALGTGRSTGRKRASKAVRPSGSGHRMSGLIGRLISHLAQKYIVEALGSTSALSEP